MLQRDSESISANHVPARFEDMIADADSAAEVALAVLKLGPGCNMARELSRAVEARYKRLEHEMGFATSGLRRLVCLGAISMSVVGLVLALSGLHLGLISLAIGASFLGAFILMGLLGYLYNCVLYRTTDRGRAAYKAHQEVLDSLFALCKAHNVMPDDRCRVTLDRCRAVIRGDVGFVILEILNGTILEMLFTYGDQLRQRCQTWYRQRTAAAKAT